MSPCQNMGPVQWPPVPVLQPGDGQQNNGPMPPINAFYSLLKLSKWECSSIQKRLLKLCWKVKRKGNIYLHCIAAAATAIHWTCNIVTGCDRDITHHISVIVIIDVTHSSVPCTGQWLVVLQKVPSEFYPKVCNHGEGPY